MNISRTVDLFLLWTVELKLLHLKSKFKFTILNFCYIFSFQDTIFVTYLKGNIIPAVFKLHPETTNNFLCVRKQWRQYSVITTAVTVLPSRSLEMQSLRRHKPSSWWWAQISISLYTPSVTALLHSPPAGWLVRCCCPQHPPSQLWGTYWLLSICSSSVGSPAPRH